MFASSELLDKSVPLAYSAFVSSSRGTSRIQNNGVKMTQDNQRAEKQNDLTVVNEASSPLPNMLIHNGRFLNGREREEAAKHYRDLLVKG